MQRIVPRQTDLCRSFLLWSSACFIALQLLSGCGPASHDHDHDGHDHSHGDAGGDVTQETESENGTYRVSYSTEPESIPFNENFEVHTEIARADGMALSDGVEVSVDAGMPAHNHGMNTAPSTMAMGDGTFHTTGMLFHMEGRWEITVDVTENGAAERTTFQVDVTQ